MSFTRTLVFRIDSDASPKFNDKWIMIIRSFQNAPKNVYGKIRSLCKLESNISIPLYLYGFGTDKQIRLMYDFNQDQFIDTELVFTVLDSWDGHIAWSYQELEDIIIAFTIYFNKLLKAECIRGYIRMDPIIE
jgi:hypothetical protein